MERRTSRMLVLAGGILVLFVATIAILLKVIPGPHRNLDYLVIGAVATFLSMILLWVVLMQGSANAEEVLYKRRVVQDAAADEKPKV